MGPADLRAIPAEGAPSEELIESARAVLEAGGVVALPTETVYGLGVRADRSAALDGLRAIKGRDAEHAFTWHVARAPEFGTLRGIVRRLTAKYWPGPLTLVREGVAAGLEAVAAGGWTGVRMPSHDGTRAVLDAADFPVVMTSANATGAPPLTDAAAVRAAFGEEVALVLDGGPSRLAEASTVLKVGTGHFEVLREGLIELEDLRRAARLRIAFVCTGNTCRSPMAAGLARAALTERLGADPGLFGFEIGSAGVFASVGSPPSEHAVTVLAEREIDIAGHASAPAVPERMRELDHVYCLTRSHLDALLAALPPSRGAGVELLDPDGEDVPDPFGGPLETYAACAARLAEMIEARLDEWTG